MLHHAVLDIGPGNELKFDGCDAWGHGGSIRDVRCNMQVAIRIRAVGAWSCRTQQQKTSRGWWPRSDVYTPAGAALKQATIGYNSLNAATTLFRTAAIVKCIRACHSQPHCSTHHSSLRVVCQMTEGTVHTQTVTPLTRHTWESCVAKWGNSPNTTWRLR